MLDTGTRIQSKVFVQQRLQIIKNYSTIKTYEAQTQTQHNRHETNTSTPVTIFENEISMSELHRSEIENQQKMKRINKTENERRFENEEPDDKIFRFQNHRFDFR